MMMARLFQRFRSSTSARRGRSRRPYTRLGLQDLESRLALAYTAEFVVLTTQPVTYAYNIVIDDAVDAQGYGRDLYMRRGDDATPYCLIADNPEFRDSQRLSLLLTSGPVTTFFITSGGQQSESRGSLTPQPGDLPVLNPTTGLYTVDLPQENPLALQGRVQLTPGLSFTYSAVGIPANAFPPAGFPLTLTVNNANAWTSAGLSATPTGRITTLNGISTLSFQILDTNGAPINSPGVFSLLNAPYLYLNPFPANPFSFTVLAGQQTDQRLIVDLAGTGSRISLQSPWSAALGDISGSTPGVDRDPTFYSAYSGLDAVGQVCAYASEVSFSQFLGSTSTIDVGDARLLSDRVTVSGDLTRGSTVISNLPASKIKDIFLNDFVSGPGIPREAQVIAIDEFNSTVTLSAAVTVNATTAAVTFITPRRSGYIDVPYSLEVTAELQAPALNVLVSGNADRDGTVAISQSGKFVSQIPSGTSPTGALPNAVTVRGNDTDIYLEGAIAASSLNFVQRSSNAEREFDFTTRSRATDATVGTIGGGTLAVNLGNVGGTTFDVRTQLNELRIDSGVDLLGRPYRNAITVNEVKVAADTAADGQLKVSAVAASSAPITIAADDQLTFLGSAIRTSGNLVVDAGGTVLTLPATVSTGNGDVAIRGPALSTGSVVAGGSRDVEMIAGQSSRLTTRAATPIGSTTLTVSSTARLVAGMLVTGPGIAPSTTITGINNATRQVTLSTATTAASASGTVMTFVSVQGDARIDAAVRAGGAVKERVRVATNMPLGQLSGLLTVDGVDLAAGNRVLVKNQANAAQNGIYVVAAGPWVRATDAALSSQFVPGFVVFAEEGQTEEGGWCFSNAFNPIVGETGLMFEPVTATRTYSQVRLATTANVPLFGTAGLIDGRAVYVGDRILVKDQTNKAENGIYVVSAGRWERDDQADETSELTTGSYVAVQRSGITLTAALTAASNLISLPTANVANVRVGMLVEGTGIPAGTLVTAITAPNSITLSQAATTTATSSVTFTAPAVLDSGLAGTASLNGDVLQGSVTVTNLSGLNGLTAGAIQVGMVVSGVGIPPGTTVTSVINFNTISLSTAATQSATTTPLVFTAFTTVNGSRDVGGLLSTTSLRPGMVVVGANIPSGSTITDILGAASIRISSPATGTASGTPLSFFEPSGLTNAGLSFALANDAVQVDVTQLRFERFAIQSTRTNLWSPQRVLESVRVATTTDIVLAGLQSVDGVAVQPGDRILVKNQSNPVGNGVWLAATGSWTRAADPIPRDASVFIREGASGRGTTWIMNDAAHLMGQLTAGSQVVRGLTSTTGLLAGMLAIGPGIQTGTTIELVIDATSLRLSRPPVASDPNAILTFVGVGAVVPGTTPLAFIPAGGDASITAVGSIESSTAVPTSRVQGSTALLTAGRRPDGQVMTVGVIDTRVTAGRVSANAPESITLDAEGTLDVVDARTTTTGGVTVTASNTLTARSVVAASAAGTPSPVSLSSQLGDVVATAVTTPLGDITLRADGDGRVLTLNGGPLSPGVAATAGNVEVITDNGLIEVAGKLSSGGLDSDVAFRSATSFLRLLPTAVVTTSDQLIVVTPNGELDIQPGAVVNANRLAITAKLGKLTSPSAALGSFTAVEVNRTDPGDIVLASTLSLNVEGATTTLGNISITAPSLQVSGNITAATAASLDGAVTLSATAGNIGLGATVTALGDRVTLNAPVGVITQTAGQIDSQTLVWQATTSPLPGLAGTFLRVGSNLTAPGSLNLGTPTLPIVIVGASTVSGGITITGSDIRIVEVVKANGGDPVSITATAGNITFVPTTTGGGAVVSLPTTTTSGAITLSATAGQILAPTSVATPRRTTARGGPLTVAAQSADLKCNVASLSSTTSIGGLTAAAVTDLKLAGISAPGQSVTLEAVNGVSQLNGSVVAAGLKVTNGTAGVNLGSTTNSITTAEVTSGSGNVVLTSAGSLSVAGAGISTGGSGGGDGDISLKSIGGSLLLNAGITAQGDRINLDASSGSILQGPGTLTSKTLVWYAASQPTISFTATDIGQNITAPNVPLSFAVSAGQNVLATSTAGGNISITGPSVVIAEPVTAGGSGSAVSVSASTGNVTLSTATAAINAPAGSVSVSAPAGLLAAAAGSITGDTVTIASGGSVLVGQIRAATTMTITTTSGGVDVGPMPNALLQAGGALDLRNVAGPIEIRNGGRIIGNPLLLAAGRVVTFPGPISTPSDLASAIAAVNLLPVPASGTTYEIVVGASMTLSQTLTVTRPITFRGTSTSVVLSGSPSVTSGLVFNTGAGGSIVRSIAFSNFSGDAIRASSLSGLTITGVRVANSGTGIRLSSVTNSTIGGTAPGAGNVLSNCTTGIFASGICTNTRLVKNTFSGTRTQYNVAGSRGITVVR